MALRPSSFSPGQRVLQFIRQQSWQAVLQRVRLRPGFGAGTMVLATADGRLHVGRFPRLPLADAGTTLEIVRSVDSDSGGRPEVSVPFVQLSPDETQFVATTSETIRDATDSRITLYSVAGAEVRFSVTDNARPDIVFRGDDELAPPDVLVAQAQSDRLWEEDRIDVPDLPRPIVEGRFDEAFGAATIGTAGWTATGDLVIVGACPVVVAGASSGTPYPWWGLVAPLSGVIWGFVSRAPGPLPASVAVRPRPTLARAVQRGMPSGDGFAVLVDGIVQTAPALASGVVSFDGPFTR